MSDELVTAPAAAPQRYTRLKVQGFRRLRNLDLRLEPLNVIIGANGSGKTSLLEVFEILQAATREHFEKYWQDHGGVAPNLSSIGQPTKQVDLEVDLSTGAEEFLYSLSVEPTNVSFRVCNETLIERGSGGDSCWIDTTKGIDKIAARRPARPSIQFAYSHDELFRVQMFMASVAKFTPIEVGPRSAVRLPQSLQVARSPGANGEDLASCLYGLKESDPDRFEDIQSVLRIAFPHFERLNFPPVAAGMLAMTWKDKTSSRPFYMHQLSEGTLRFLWLVTLLYSPELSAVTMIDEPEVSLHPELLAILAEVMRDASSRTQLIVATHSDRLIRHLKPEEVVTLDVDEDGATTARRGDEFDLEEWLKDYTLDELWSMGRIGGRA